LFSKKAEGTYNNPRDWGAAGNVEYGEAKNGLVFTDSRILTLENLVNQAVIIDEVHEKRDTVEVGSTVMVKNPDGRTSKYTITGSAQADP